MKVSFFNKPFGPGDVKYSLFARKVTLRGTTIGINIESLKERWFEAIINGPFAGTLRRPRTLGRKASIRNGVKNARKAPYGKLFSTGLIYCLLTVMTPSEGE
jgi:hypothetical protein